MRRSPTGIATLDAPRLACVKPIASVHPEPGSNSPLFKLFFYPIALRIQIYPFPLFSYIDGTFFLVLHLVLHVNLTKIAFYFCVPLEHFQRITLFLFFYPITESVTGCKDKNKFLFEPNLFESFFLERSLFSYQTHLFETNKKKNTPPEKSFLYLLAAGSPLESGCKSTEYLLSLQIFYDLFLKKKCKLLRSNCL